MSRDSSSQYNDQATAQEYRGSISRREEFFSNHLWGPHNQTPYSMSVGIISSSVKRPRLETGLLYEDEFLCVSPYFSSPP